MALVTIQGNNPTVRYEFDPESKANIIGRGGMGIVFKGRMVNVETESYEYVAIKVLFRDLNEDSVNRARREASIRIVHENLLRMYDFVETNDGTPKYHVISEYLKGETLDNFIKREGILPQEKSISIIKNILSALYMLHTRGFIHRDIDPSNIMMCKDGKIKIIDFGIAKQVNEYHNDFKNGTINGTFIGKINYASPEQAEGNHWMTNATSDIYSTGILLYQLLTGNLPFTGSTYEIIQGHRESPIPISESLSPDIQYIISKASAKNQEDRYQSASEFIVDLEKLEKGISPIPAKSVQYRKWIMVASAVVVIICAVFGLFSIRSNNIEKAEGKLAIGLYSESLDLFKKANTIIKSNEVSDKIAMLKALVPAVDEYNNSNYLIADSLLREATKLNSADAWYYLGEMSYEGIGAPKNYKLGYEYTSMAAEMGSVLAEYRLGLVYENGLGVAVDNVKALKYYETAGRVIDEGVDNKNPEHLYIKGSMYLNGNYVKMNKERAIEFYTEAANIGYPQAQYELFLLLGEENGLEWLINSANKGYPKAEYKMGKIAEIKKDYSDAVNWMMKSAERNYSPAFVQLGRYYSEANAALNIGVISNNFISHEYTMKALQYDFENFEAMFDLYTDYQLGIGCEIDLDKSIIFLEQTKEKLNELSYRTINDMRVYNDQVAQNIWDKISNK